MAEAKLITERSATIIKGISYSASLGSMSYSAGTSASVSASVDSKISMGASWSFNLASAGGSFTFYDSKFSQHLAGASSGIEEAYQKTYQDTFSITVGSLDPFILKKISLFTKIALISQITLVAGNGLTSLGFYANKGVVSDHVSLIQGSVASGVQILSTLSAVVGAVWMANYKHSKVLKLVNEAQGTIGISKNARAFLGVQGSDQASGLSFHKGNFELASIGGGKGKFARAGLGQALASGNHLAVHGWEAVGFNEPEEASTKISGDTEELKILSNKIALERKVVENQKKQTEMQILLDSDGLLIENKKAGSKTRILSKSEVLIKGGDVFRSHGRMRLADHAASLKVGPIGMGIEESKIKLMGFLKDPALIADSMGVTVGHGKNAAVFNSMGINIGNGAITILNGAVAIPAVGDQMKAQKEELELKTSLLAEATKNLLNEKKKELEEKLLSRIDKVKSSVEAQLRFMARLT